MSGMKPYIVRQGDYLAKIALVNGVNQQDVWNSEKTQISAALGALLMS